VLEVTSITTFATSCGCSHGSSDAARHTDVATNGETACAGDCVYMCAHSMKDAVNVVVQLLDVHVFA